MRFDCVRAASGQEAMQWTSTMSTEQHAVLVRQWMLPADDRSRSDEWIPAEWLLRAWENPTMAAAEAGSVGLDTRLFEIDARPVLLARSISVVIPELSLAGVDQFRVMREVPSWWLLGPCGREVLALLTQFQTLAAERDQEPMSVDPDLVSLRTRALDVVDATGRIGAYAVLRAVVGEVEGRQNTYSQLALGAALGFLVKDVWPEAPHLYRPWVKHYGLPDLGAIIRDGDLPYPTTLAL
jgi:hypothetical protein